VDFKNVRKFITSILFLAMFCSTAFASKSSDLNYLMNEPLTLFDYGMIKLRENVDEEWAKKYDENHPSKTHGTVTRYDLKTDTIIIRGHFMGYTGEKDLKSLCVEALKTLRNPYRKLESEDVLGYGLGSFFTHDGYMKSNRPKNIHSGLRQLVDVSVVIIQKSSEVSLECKGDLVSEKIYFSE
jgi:hypothetical protein